MDTDVSACCPICLQRLLQPVKIPCGHVFCYLCIKGSAFHRRRCPLCRGAISMHFFDRPDIIRSLSSTHITEPANSDWTWYYEGRNGWWQYDDRSATDIETAFRRSNSSCDVFIAGHIYVIDFSNMCQYRKDNSGRSRRIKRDSVNLNKKGVSGIRLSLLLQPREASEGEAAPSNDASPTVILPNNVACPTQKIRLSQPSPATTPRPPPSTSTSAPISSSKTASRNDKFPPWSRTP